MAGEERQDAGIFAYTLVEHVADQEGDENAQSYLIEVVDEVMLLEPGVKEHFTDMLLTELVEEMHRLGARHCAALVELIRTKWGQDA